MTKRSVRAGMGRPLNVRAALLLVSAGAGGGVMALLMLRVGA